jgi:putative two-component system response regulator
MTDAMKIPNGPGTIMVVDDTPDNLRLLSEMLTDRGYRVRAFPGGELALRAAAKDPPDAMLLDVDMPSMTGYEVCRRLKADARLSDIPVLFISALHDTEAKVSAFEHGAQDYITKPFRFEEVDARIKTHLKIRGLQLELEAHNQHLEKLVAAQIQEISDSQFATILAMAKLAESRDDDTGHHIERVRIYSKMLAKTIAERSDGPSAIDEQFVQTIFHAAPLHDIGKVAIPDAILLKQGKLTPEEFEVIKTHAMRGAETLEAVLKSYPKNYLIRMGVDIARHHHEKWNGSGYPDHLASESIPVSARIVALADVYDALCSKRPYKEPFSHEKAVGIIGSESGKHFDPALVEAFLGREAEFASIREELND